MAKRHPILAAAAILLLGMAGATAGQLPRYDVAGFPVTPHQMSVLEQSGDTQEQPSVPMLLREGLPGLPASPHQIAVLSRHAGTTAPSARPFEAAEARTGTITRSE